ncbi:hypothetical protein Tco_0604111 [Tanacetum coccineum]
MLILQYSIKEYSSTGYRRKNMNPLMRIDELHNIFKVQRMATEMTLWICLNDRLKGISSWEMYLATRLWSPTRQSKARSMIQAIVHEAKDKGSENEEKKFMDPLVSSIMAQPLPVFSQGQKDFVSKVTETYTHFLIDFLHSELLRIILCDFARTVRVNLFNNEDVKSCVTVNIQYSSWLGNGIMRCRSLRIDGISNKPGSNDKAIFVPVFIANCFYASYVNGGGCAQREWRSLMKIMLRLMSRFAKEGEAVVKFFK